MKYIVDIKGKIEGDYEIISKYVEPKYILKTKNLTAEDRKRFQECWNKSEGGLLAIPDNYEIIPIERLQDEWGKWVISEIRCPNCLEYFQTDCYSTEELKKCPNCGAKMKGGVE